MVLSKNLYTFCSLSAHRSIRVDPFINTSSSSNYITISQKITQLRLKHQDSTGKLLGRYSHVMKCMRISPILVLDLIRLLAFQTWG
jgi:hypothetical protein